MGFHSVDVLTQLCALLGGHLLLAARLFKLLYQRVSLSPCPRYYPLSFLLCSLDLALGVLTRAARFVLGALLLGVRLRGKAVRVLDLLFKALPLLLELSDNVLELSALARHQLLCTVDDRRVHSEPLRNSKRVALAGYADEQSVGRLQGSDVEFAAAVFYSLRAQGKFLELSVVGGRGNFGVLFAQFLEYRRRESRALDGVGAGTQLVNQTERASIRELKNLDNIRHVSREGRQTLLDALFVADVDKHPAENAQLAVIRAGYEQSAHSHKREQPEGLEGNGLAARIRACDHKGIKGLAEGYVNGHYPVLRDKRMTRLTDTHLAAVVHNRAARAH